MQQRESILTAFQRTGARFCAGERLVIGGLPERPSLRTIPPSLRRDVQPVFLLALRGLLTTGNIPRQIELQCKER